MPDRQLAIEARASRKELQSARSDIARLEVDIDRRTSAIERLTTEHHHAQALAEGNDRSRERIAAFSERIVEIEPRHFAALEELGRRGVPTISALERAVSRPEVVVEDAMSLETATEVLKTRPPGLQIGQ